MPIKTILVVDDSATDRQFLTDLLTKSGYKVSGAASAEEALAKVKQAKPGPRPHGHGDAGPERLPGDAHAHHDDATKDIPVIICSTKGQETDKVWGMRQGAKDYIVKPVKTGGPARQDYGARLMTARLSLRDYQRDLAERLRNAEAGQSASMLGLQVDDDAWLVDLRDAGEVIPVPPITPLPLTRPWFRGSPTSAATSTAWSISPLSWGARRSRRATRRDCFFLASASGWAPLCSWTARLG